MKTILLTLGASSLLFFSTSCRTYVPINPNTGIPSCDMMPDKAHKCCSTKDCTPCCKTHAKVEVKPSK